MSAAHAVDPECGMEVEIASARHTAERGGIKYYFCSAHCQTSFERDPARYAPAGS
ncbi:MAG: YHS domain-containing protein [Armatimonadota bacterium]|nr:YHS domain-containing protein [Armatimonadota bacterium]MDR7473240.1 YHS domain-containing protein [Armatimonadota bacterium]MDR7517611.1 YHS domain-containing protein [Armatimonadota bacterium]